MPGLPEISLTAVLAMLLLWVEHWFPWQLMLGRELPRPAAYILGVLALMLPFSGLLIIWSEWLILAALWAVILAGGLSVLGAYFVDHVLIIRKRVQEQTELIEVLRETAAEARSQTHAD